MKILNSVNIAQYLILEWLEVAKTLIEWFEYNLENEQLLLIA